MIIDSSAILAILFGEEDAPRYAEAIEKAPTCLLSAANWLETAIRIDRERSEITSKAFDDFVREAELIVESVTQEHANLARSAYRAYGKGTGHPAQLNFGDCFSYALSKQRRTPLLFKGDDFSKTDIESALS